MPPLKSQAERGKLFELEKEGKLPPGKAEEFVRETPNHGKNLPEHVKKATKDMPRHPQGKHKLKIDK